MPLAAVESDTFRIFTHTHHGKTEIRFVFLLHKIQSYQLIAHFIGQPGTQDGIQQGRPYQITRNMDIHTGNFELQGTGQVIKYQDKGSKGRKGF